MADLTVFLTTISAISGVVQVMIAQDTRLKQFPITETFSKGSRAALPPGYRQVVKEINEQAEVAGRTAMENASVLVDSPGIQAVSLALPRGVGDAMTANVERCWTRLTEFITDDQYTPAERTAAHIRARRCVCNELNELLNYVKVLPLELQNYWELCGCTIGDQQG